MDGTQRHLRDHRSVAFLDLLLCARKRIDGIPAGHIPEVTVERDHRLRWQFPLNDGFLWIWPIHSACLVRESGIYGRVQDEGAELRDSFWVPRAAVPLELVDAGVVLGGGRDESGRGGVISGVLT